MPDYIGIGKIMLSISINFIYLVKAFNNKAYSLTNLI
jgi:hypothetical protein